MLATVTPSRPVAKTRPWQSSADARAPGERQTPAVPQPYELRRYVTEGGMGSIYECRRRTDGQRCALKFIHSELLAGNGAIARAFFTREAEALERLVGTPVPVLYDHGYNATGLPYLALEWLEGRTLFAVLDERGPLEPVRAGHVMVQLADALDQLHARGVVHADLKPENLMVTPGGAHGEQLRLFDLGCAVLDGCAVVPKGELSGTPGYLAPEVARGAVPNESTDVYAAGVICFEMLFGLLPFEDLTTSARLQQGLPDLLRPRSSVRLAPGPLEAVVRRALAPRPDERYPCAAAFAHALRGALRPEFLHA